PGRVLLGEHPREPATGRRPLPERDLDFALLHLHFAGELHLYLVARLLVVERRDEFLIGRDRLAVHGRDAVADLEARLLGRPFGDDRRQRRALVLRGVAGLKTHVADRLLRWAHADLLA